MDNAELKFFLDLKYNLYNVKSFIDSDPIQIPHRFTKIEDIEIAAFLTATIAWGQRPTIIRNASRLMELMDNAPHDFILHANKNEYARFDNFVHRTFNSTDCVYFLKALRNIYQNYGGLHNVFENHFSKTQSICETFINFRKIFLEKPHLHHVEKHISDVSKNSAAKRLNLFLMWMVRNKKQGVHFGLWDKIPASALYIPLDTHVSKVAHALGLLTRKQNDWLAVEELTAALRKFDKDDPVKYDFALFGLGIFEKFV